MPWYVQPKETALSSENIHIRVYATRPRAAGRQRRDVPKACAERQRGRGGVGGVKGRRWVGKKLACVSHLAGRETTSCMWVYRASPLSSTPSSHGEGRGGQKQSVGAAGNCRSASGACEISGSGAGAGGLWLGTGAGWGCKRAVGTTVNEIVVFHRNGVARKLLSRDNHIPRQPERYGAARHEYAAKNQVYARVRYTSKRREPELNRHIGTG